MPMLIDAVRFTFRAVSSCLLVAFLVIGLAGVVPGQIRSAAAEDITTSIPTGGLVFAPDPSIEFDSETLTVSANTISVVYNLRNSSDSDRTILITFPLPVLDMVDLTAGSVKPIAPGNVNFVDFTVTVNNQSVDLDWEQRAIALGLDVTSIIKAADLPLGPDLEEMADQVSILEPDNREFLRQRGVLQVDEPRLVPAWLLKTTFYWSQEIEAGKTARVELKYTPVSGRQEYTPQALAEYRDTYCINQPTSDAIEERALRGGGPPTLSRFSYLMTQGAHWSKPSAIFRLVIEKADPSVVIATCRRGFAPFGSGNLQWSARDFTPSDELELLFVR